MNVILPNDVPLLEMDGTRITGRMHWRWRAYFAQLDAILSPKVYTPTNVVDSRALDAAAATLAETRQVLGTLIEDLQSKGVLT